MFDELKEVKYFKDITGFHSLIMVGSGKIPQRKIDPNPKLTLTLALNRGKIVKILLVLGQLPSYNYLLQIITPQDNYSRDNCVPDNGHQTIGTWIIVP